MLFNMKSSISNLYMFNIISKVKCNISNNFIPCANEKPILNSIINYLNIKYIINLIINYNLINFIFNFITFIIFYLTLLLTSQRYCEMQDFTKFINII